MWYWLAPLLILVVVALVVLAWRPLKTFGREVQVERARELFHLQRARLQEQFFQTAAASGKPRGLRWKECLWENPVEFARERKSGQIAALVQVSIQFEAVEGGDMEDVPAVHDLKNASAVFYFDRGQWRTLGQALFNKNPNEVICIYNNYERVGPG
jgi:hypothetical protein